jgi:hypothetical protein
VAAADPGLSVINPHAAGIDGKAIEGAVLKGERDPDKRAELSDPRIKTGEEETARSLEGNRREDVLFELKQAVDRLPQPDAGVRPETGSSPGHSAEPDSGTAGSRTPRCAIVMHITR